MSPPLLFHQDDDACCSHNCIPCSCVPLSLLLLDATLLAETQSRFNSHQTGGAANRCQTKKRCPLRSQPQKEDPRVHGPHVQDCHNLAWPKPGDKVVRALKSLNAHSATVIQQCVQEGMRRPTTVLRPAFFAPLELIHQSWFLKITKSFFSLALGAKAAAEAVAREAVRSWRRCLCHSLCIFSTALHAKLNSEAVRPSRVGGDNGVYTMFGRRSRRTEDAATLFIDPEPFWQFRLDRPAAKPACCLRQPADPGQAQHSIFSLQIPSSECKPRP